MKQFQKLGWIAFGVALFLSFNLLLSATLVESKSPPLGLESLAPSTAQSTTILGAAGVELAQSPEAASIQTLAEADELYRAGQTQQAENLYRKVKPDFPPAPSTKGAEPVYEIEELDQTAQGYWRSGLDAIEKNLDSQIFPPLQKLTANYPQFIPGYLKLAEACKKEPEACESSAQNGEAKNAIAVLERATELYPNDPELIKAKVEALANADDFIEASIAARQFAVFYGDDPESPEFARLADKYLKSYQKKMKPLVIGGTVSQIGSIVGSLFSKDFSLDSVLKTDFSKEISGIETIKLMLNGESAFGKKVAQEYKKQHKLVEDPVVINYVKGLAGRITPYMGRDFEYEYYVVKDSSLNAFALPGGKIFVNTGAILKTESEAELTGLLAHEISHAVLSHGLKRIATVSLLSNLDKLNLNQKIPFANFVSELVTKEYSRKQERQSDILGTRVLAASGYAADGLRNLMVTLAKQNGDVPTTWQGTHPASAERVSYLESLIQNNGYNRYAYEGVKTHLEIKKLLENSRF